MQDKGTFKGRKNEWVMYRSAIISRKRKRLRPINKTMSSIMLCSSWISKPLSTFGPPSTTTWSILSLSGVAHTHINIYLPLVSPPPLPWNGLVIFWQHLPQHTFKKKFALAAPEIYFQHIFPQSSDGKRWGKTFAVCGARVIDSVPPGKSERAKTNCRKTRPGKCFGFVKRPFKLLSRNHFLGAENSGNYFWGGY